MQYTLVADRGTLVQRHLHDDMIQEDIKMRDPNMDEELGLHRDPHTRELGPGARPSPTQPTDYIVNVTHHGACVSIASCPLVMLQA